MTVLACAMVCPHMAAAAAGVAEVCQAALAQLGNQQVHALGTSLLGSGLFCFVLFFWLKEETENSMTPRPHLPTWLTQILGDKPWTRRWREALDQLALKLKAAEKNPMLPRQRKLTVRCAAAHRLPWSPHHHHCFLFQKRYVFLVSLFSFD